MRIDLAIVYSIVAFIFLFVPYISIKTERAAKRHEEKLNKTFVSKSSGVVYKMDWLVDAGLRRDCENRIDVGTAQLACRFSVHFDTWLALSDGDTVPLKIHMENGTVFDVFMTAPNGREYQCVEFIETR